LLRSHIRRFPAPTSVTVVLLSIMRAIPKSATNTSPFDFTMILAGFDIAMHASHLMGVMQGGTYRLNDLQYALQRKGACLIEYLLAKGGPFHKIHEHERKPLNLSQVRRSERYADAAKSKASPPHGKKAQKDPVFGQVRIGGLSSPENRALTIYQTLYTSPIRRGPTRESTR